MNYTISRLRNFAIIAIVLHHTISAFCGWPPNHAVGGEIPQWVLYTSAMCKPFGLGLFTFISGYVLYYQWRKRESFARFLLKKTRRILLPCLICAFMYGMLFSSYMYYDWWPAAINGTHLWYLPMLFLCIMIVSLHFYVKHSLLFICISLAFILVLAKLTHFRTLTEMCMYFPVFYSGFLIHKLDLEKLVLKCRGLWLLIAVSGGDYGF